jgi:hypothetical protein
MTGDAGWLGTATLLCLLFAASALIARSRLPRALKLLVIAALGLRVVGSFARLTVLEELYGGGGDATGYFGHGLRFAEAVWQGDLAAWGAGSGPWRGGSLVGTQFVRYVTGVIVTFVGPTKFGVTLVFSLLALGGLVALAVTFHRNWPAVPVARYARWIWLFPSLWFWPSSIGKEALVLCGLGLAVFGYAGGAARIRWLPLAAGSAFVFAVRPEMAGVLLGSLVIAEIAGLRGRWTLRRSIEVAAVAILGLAGVRFVATELGVEGLDPANVTDYVESEPARRLGGGSGISPPTVGLAGVPGALLNTLARPFPWESRGAAQMLASAEVGALWLILLIRRRRVIAALRAWRANRFLRFAVVFTALYAVGLGMTAANLGLITRQRVLLLPFVFLLLEAVPALTRTGARVRSHAASQRKRPLARQPA